MTREQLLKKVAKAVIEGKPGFSQRLTKLVDGEYTYTIKYSDSDEVHTFVNPIEDDMGEHIREYCSRKQAEAILTALGI